MHEREYNRLRKQIESEYRDKLRALEIVWKMAGKNGVVPRKAVVDDGSLAGMVRTAVDRTEGTFSMRDILAYCREEGDATIRQSSVSAILKRMADQRLVSIVEAGSGRRPTSYRKP